MASALTLKAKLNLLLVKGLTTEKVHKRMLDRLESDDADDVEEATEFITSSYTAYEKTTRAKKVEITTLSGDEEAKWRREQKETAIADLKKTLPTTLPSVTDFCKQHGFSVEVAKTLSTLQKQLGMSALIKLVAKVDKLPAPKMKKDLTTGEMTSASNNRLRDAEQIVDGKVFAVQNARGKTTKNERVVKVESLAKTKGYTLDGVEDMMAIKIVSSQTDERGNRHAQITPIVRQFPLEHAGEGCCPAEVEFQQLEMARVWDEEENTWVLPPNYEQLVKVRVCCNAKVKGGGKYCARHGKANASPEDFTALGGEWASVVVG